MSASDKGERLQVVLARLGLASRRGVVDMIEAGEVKVNGAVVREKGARVFAERDRIEAQGRVFEPSRGPVKRYFILNKPKGVMTTMQDPNAEHIVADFFNDIPERLFPVGRLDRDTTGLLLMTNDGELAYRLTHPKFGVNKRYKARVRGAVTPAEVTRLKKGVELEEGRTAPCHVEVETSEPRESRLFVTLHEGKKRQIRRMFDDIGHTVLDLERLSYGPITLGDLRFGQRRELKPAEVRALYAAAGLKHA